MALHFNLKGMFLFCAVLTVWQLFLPYTPTVGGLAMASAAIWFGIRDKRFSVADGIFAAAFAMNLWYVCGSWGNVRQYDYFNFVMHADYFVKNGFFATAPGDYLQSVYFQPPLWGLISGIFMKLATFDSVRFASLFCVSGAGIVFWRLMGEFHFKKNVRLGLFALFCFFPANSIMANLVNNDALVYFLMTAMMYAGYKWYVSGMWRDALMLAGLLLTAGLTKFSGLMMIPALGVLELFRLAQAKDKFSGRLWGQFAVIGVGAGAGFMWGWLLLYHHLPLVPPPVDIAFQEMGGYKILERLFSWERAGIPFANVRAGELEPNVWLALLKTALFGEWGWQGTIWAYMLYGLGAALALLAFWTFFSLSSFKLGEGWGFNAFAVVLAFSVLGAWINFWLDYPYFCSSEFRYVIILLPLSLLWIGNYLSQKSLPKAAGYALAGSLGLFISAKFMLYLNTI